METPSLPHLQHIAKFEVGDEVYLYGTAKWRITARYWSRREQCILYDILFEYTQVESKRKREEELEAVNPKR